MSEAQTTTDHDELRKWVEERGGSPAAVKATGSKDEPGILRIGFPGYCKFVSRDERSSLRCRL